MTSNSTKTVRAKHQSNKDWPMTGIEDPHANDVLYGRGGGTNHHPGNKKFRKLVEDNKLKYLMASRVDKAIVALALVRSWRNQNPPGRFLKEDKAKGLWDDVGDKRAREKTSQALRENAPELRKEQMDVLEPLLDEDDDDKGDTVMPAKQEDSVHNEKTTTGKGHYIDMKDKRHVDLPESSLLGQDYSTLPVNSIQVTTLGIELPVVLDVNTMQQSLLYGDYNKSLSDDLSVNISFEHMDGDRGRSWGSCRSGHCIVSGGSTGPYKVPEEKDLLALQQQCEKRLHTLGQHRPLNTDRSHSFSSSLPGSIASQEPDPDPLGRMGSEFWDVSASSLSPDCVPNKDPELFLPLRQSGYMSNPDKLNFAPSYIEVALFPQNRFSSDERPQSKSSQMVGRRTLSWNSDHDSMITGIQSHQKDPTQQDAIPLEHHTRNEAACFDEDPVVFQTWISQLAKDYEMVADIFGTVNKSSSSLTGQDHDTDTSQMFPSDVSFQSATNCSTEGTYSGDGLNACNADDLLKLEMPKRVPSKYDADERSMYFSDPPVKRAALNNRDGSLASNALKAKYVPKIVNRSNSSVSVRDIDMLNDSMGQSTIGMLDEDKKG